MNPWLKLMILEHERQKKKIEELKKSYADMQLEFEKFKKKVEDNRK